MAQGTDKIRGSASGNCETVVFNVVDPPKDTRQIHISNDKFRSKYRGVTKPPKGRYWFAFYRAPDGKFYATHRTTEVRAAVWVDNKIRELGTGVKTNEDLYGEYWK